MAAPTGEDLVAGIKEILANSELDSLTSKKVRKALEARFEQDLSERKKEIDQLLMDELAAGQAAATSSAQSPSPPPKKKARKAESSESEASGESGLDLSADGSGDEAVARRLHEAENARGRKAKGKAKEEKKPRKKSGRPKGSGSIYSKECLISEELARVLGTDRMARKDVVSNMWKIIKERNLQDPKNKQFVNCDDDLYSVFKTKRFKAFGMMKYLKTHIKDAHFVSDGKEAD